MKNITPIQIVLILVIFLILFFNFYFLINKLFLEQGLKNRNIKVRKKILKESEKKNDNTWFNYLISKLDDEYLDVKLIHSGYPLGMKNVSNYVLMKALFTALGLVMGFQLYNKDNIMQSLAILFVCTVVGFFIVNYIIAREKKSRIAKINNQLPLFLVYFDTYNKAGMMFEDILSTIIDALKGELKKEVIRYNVSYAMTKDFEDSTNEFIRRLGTDEADSIEIKLKQCFYSGVFDDVISDEKEIIDKKIVNDIAQQTKKFELYNGIAIGLLIFNIFLIVVYPLMNIVKDNMSGIF